jgi:hypothetical protein
MTPAEKLAAEVDALPLDQKLQLAAEAVRRGRRDIALAVVENARLDLLAETLLGATTHANEPTPVNAQRSAPTKENP